MQHFGISSYFDSAIDSSETGLEKPEPALFRLACTELGANPEDCWFIGDGLINDTLGSRSASFGTSILYDRYDMYARLPGVARILELRDLLRWVDSAVSS